MPGPFENYVSQKYNIPGSSDDSPAYFMRQSLEPAGWSDDAIKWAIGNVPTSFTGDEIQGIDSGVPTADGLYRRGPGDAQIRLGRDDAPDPLFSLPYNTETTRHELQHAWDNQRGSGFPTGQEARSALGALGYFQPSTLDFVERETDADRAHGTNFLYEALGPEGIDTLPMNFRQKFFGNMKGTYQT